MLSTFWGKHSITDAIYRNVLLFTNYNVRFYICSNGDILYGPSITKVALPRDFTGNLSPSLTDIFVLVV